MIIQFLLLGILINQFFEHLLSQPFVTFLIGLEYYKNVHNTRYKNLLMIAIFAQHMHLKGLNDALHLIIRNVHFAHEYQLNTAQLVLITKR